MHINAAIKAGCFKQDEAQMTLAMPSQHNHCWCLDAPG